MHRRGSPEFATLSSLIWRSWFRRRLLYSWDDDRAPGHGASERGEENRGSLGIRRERYGRGTREIDPPSLLARIGERGRVRRRRWRRRACSWRAGGWVVEAGVGAAEGEGTSPGDGRVGGEQGAKRFRKARASRRQHCGPGVSQFASDRQQRAFVSTAWSTYRPSSRGWRCLPDDTPSFPPCTPPRVPCACARALVRAPTPFPFPFRQLSGSPIVMVLTGPRASPSRVYIAAGTSFLSRVSTPGD